MFPLSPTRSSVAVVFIACTGATARAGLEGHWRLDEAAGATVASDSTGSYPGTLVNSAAFVPGGGVAGGAISITQAGNGYVTMGNVLPFASNQSFTISLWIKMQTNPAVNQFPLSKHTSGIVNGYVFGVHASGSYGAANRAWFYDGTFPGGEANSTTSVNDNVWHHVVGVHVADGQKRIYVDGVQEATNIQGNVALTAAPLMLGGLFIGGAPTSVYTGMIDDVQIYSEALSSQEIAYLFNNPGAIICRGDLDATHAVDSTDLNILLTDFGCTSSCSGDADMDGDADSTDLNVILSNFGEVCEPSPAP